MQTNDFYCVCNLPAIPDPLIKIIVDSAGKSPQYDGTKRVSAEAHKELFDGVGLEIDGKQYTRATYRRFNVPELVSKWVSKNICEDFSQIGVHLMASGGAFSPHTDGGPRMYILNYLIHTGGDNVETKFWQEKGQSLVREGPAMQYSNADNLDLVSSVVVSKGTWSALYGKVIHSISNITGSRIALTIGLSREQFLALKEKHNLDLKYYAGE